jgi:hydrogenase nickel incorporation protein HypB
MKINIGEKVLSENDKIAMANRALFDENNIYVLNMISSPGAGKTSIIERLLQVLSNKYRAYVLIGDVQTENDANRIKRLGFKATQIITGGGCHLNAKMISERLKEMQLADLDLVIIENVGNLVCPSAYDLGEDDKIVVLSVPEGEDKPIKYPSIFSKASLMLLNKIDLLPFIQFEKNKALEYARAVNPGIEIIELSCVTGDGIDQLGRWLEKRIEGKKRQS